MYPRPLSRLLQWLRCRNGRDQRSKTREASLDLPPTNTHHNSHSRLSVGLGGVFIAAISTATTTKRRCQGPAGTDIRVQARQLCHTRARQPPKTLLFTRQLLSVCSWISGRAEMDTDRQSTGRVLHVKCTYLSEYRDPLFQTRGSIRLFRTRSAQIPLLEGKARYGRHSVKTCRGPACCSRRFPRYIAVPCLAPDNFSLLPSPSHF